MPALSPDLSRTAVIIPCFNEARKIAAVVESLPGWIALVVIVDDCSTDDTSTVLASLSDARVITVRHQTNQGVGGAVLTGYGEARQRGAEICVKMDGDGQMSPEHLEALLAPLVDGSADYTKGNRFYDVDALKSMPRVRLVGNGMLSFLTKLVSGYWSVFDPVNGFTAVRTETLTRLDVRHIGRRYFFETSMLVELNIEGAVVSDVPMPAIYGDEESSMSIRRVLVRFPPLLVRALSRRFFWRYVVRDFNVLTLCVIAGLPMLAFGVTFGSYYWWQSIATGVPATAGTTLVAALPVLLGYVSLLMALVLDVVYQPKRR